MLGLYACDARLEKLDSSPYDQRCQDDGNKRMKLLPYHHQGDGQHESNNGDH